jgi:hypothetical protein
MWGRRADCAETAYSGAVKAIAVFCTLWITREAQARPLHSADRASEIAAAHWGYYVDHPERPVPGAAPCNVLAKAGLERLRALGYRAYYLTAFIPSVGEGHIMVAVDFDTFTAVWDSLRAQPVTADQLIAEGYILLGARLTTCGTTSGRKAAEQKKKAPSEEEKHSRPPAGFGLSVRSD